MKSFLKVLLVGTILVSATDGYSGNNYSYRGTRYENTSSSSASSTASLNDPQITDTVYKMKDTNPVTVSLTEGLKYNGEVMAYWKNGKWYVEEAGSAAGFRITGGKLDFSAPQNLKITGTEAGFFSFGGSSELDIRNAGLLDGVYTIENVETPTGIVLNGQYTVKQKE